MKFHIETIGCQQNEYDASRLAIFLKSAGFVETSAKEADTIFILACSVRQTAVDRIFGRIKNWAIDKKVIVTSCLTPEDQTKIIDRGACYWQFGDIKNLKKIINIKTDTKFQRSRGFSINDRGIEQYGPSTALGVNITSYVPIMSGCNNFCSYCIVPYTRGREKSRPVDDIIKEVSELIKSGKKQIILLGQNVNSYKNSVIPDLTRNPLIEDSRLRGNDKTDFAILLEMINDLPWDFEISFMSNHPKDMTAVVIEAIATLPKVKKEIHLPLQSGSDKVLKDMNRPYSSQQYLDLVANLKFKIENLKLTTDIIVGFPTETEEDFQQTVEVCKKVGFSLAYVNKYSPRKGTASYKLGDPIPWSEKQRRWKILDGLIN